MRNYVPPALLKLYLSRDRLAGIVYLGVLSLILLPLYGLLK